MLLRYWSVLLRIAFISLAVIFSDGSREVGSEKFLKILLALKKEASVLARDVADLESFSHTQSPWQSYTGPLARTRTHLSKVRDYLRQLSNWRIVATPWQRACIDRLYPILRELADNVQLILKQLNSHPSRIHRSSYCDYLSAHRTLASHLASLVDELVTYGELKAKLDHLSGKLDA